MVGEGQEGNLVPHPGRAGMGWVRYKVVAHHALGVLD